MKIHNNLKEGSALLIALVIMGILLTISLGVSELLIGAMRDTRLFFEKTRAWYAAESGLEQALFSVYQGPPGFEEQKKHQIKNANSDYEYKIFAAANKYPMDGKYTALRLNESVNIPLFRGSKSEDKVQNFRVDYYLAPDLQLSGGQIDNDLDILRWKIFGIASDGKMEVISEFIPANKGNSAENPTCLGTGANCYNAAKFYKRQLAQDGGAEFNIIEQFPISTFLSEHSQNFLVLTNVTNIDMVSGALSPNEKQKIANIRYKIADEDGKPNLTLPTISIASDGISGTTKQSIDLELKRDTFLPAFNYALYRTAE